MGIVLSTTALPAMANVVSPSARVRLGHDHDRGDHDDDARHDDHDDHDRATRSPRRRRRTSPVTLASLRHRRPRPSRSNSNGSASPTTTVPTPTTVVTPTTVAPTTTTTVKSPPPVTKAPALSISNPSANIAPSPNFLAPGTCSFVCRRVECANPCVVGTATALSWPGYTNGVACTNYVLAAINNARAIEGVRPMVLPSNWFSLTSREQLFVVADLERTARGLPAVPRDQRRAQRERPTRRRDQQLTRRSPPGSRWRNDAQGSAGFGGAWSGGYTVLAADYVWMYDDTWGGSAAKTSNIACTSRRRRRLLGPP